MRILVTGSRSWIDVETIRAALVVAWSQHPEMGNDPTPRPTLVSGACPTGADAIAERLAATMHWPIEKHPAEWSIHGKAAGPIRNQLMVNLGADLCLAFPLPESRGTHDCIRRAQASGIPTRIREPRS